MSSSAQLRTPSREALVDAVVEDGDPRVRRAAIRALAQFKDDAEEISEILIRHVESETSDYAIADSVRTVAELRAEGARAFVDTVAANVDACVEQILDYVNARIVLTARSR